MTDRITAESLLTGYARGIFPMAESERDDVLFWVDPLKRGILPLDGLHISRSLARRMRNGGFSVRIDTNFAGVVDGCADRDETWINRPLRTLYLDLFDMGAAHSVEVMDGEELIGGVFGVAINAAFFGESMFSRRSDASKIALAFLVDRLRVGGFELFDTQFITPHLASLGAQEISRADYHKRLRASLEKPADFNALGPDVQVSEVLQRNTQTS